MTTASDLPAGRELDALVAEKVMGWKRRRIVECYPGMVGVPLDDPRLDDYWWTSDNRPTNEIARDEGGGAVGECNECGKVYGAGSPSTDIAAAWTVVEKLRGCDQWPEIGATGRSWYCEFEGEPGVIVEGFGDTAPLAICRAALKAVGHG